MNYLIDSDWLINFLKGRPEAVELMNRLDPDTSYMSIISYGELYQGIIFGRNRSQNEESFERLVENIEIIGLDTETMSIFASTRG